MASTPSIATVLHVTGKAFARDTAGHLRAIRPGDSVREGEVVVTRDGATVELTLANGEHLAVKPDQSVKLDPELLGSGHVDVSENAVAADSIKDVLRLLSEGKDLDLDAPGPACRVAASATKGITSCDWCASWKTSRRWPLPSAIPRRPTYRGWLPRTARSRCPLRRR